MIKVYRNPDLPLLSLGQQSLLPWWVQVPPHLPVSGLTLQLTTTDNLDDIEVLSSQSRELFAHQVTSGQPIQIHTPLRFHKPGHYAVRLRATVTVATFGAITYESEGALTLQLREADGKLVLNIDAAASVILDGSQLQQRAGQINVKAGGHALVDLSELPTPSSPTSQESQVQFDRFRQEHVQHEFPMVPTEAPKPDLEAFWEGWRRWFGDQQRLREITLLRRVDNSRSEPKIERAHIDEAVKLRLTTQHPGQPSHLLLLQQSTEGNFMQCAPTVHGDARMTPMVHKHFPRDLFGGMQDDDGNPIDELLFDSQGVERFLAVVTSEPLVGPVEALAVLDSGDGAVMNRHLSALEVSKVLTSIWNHRAASAAPPIMEIGFLKFEVVAG